MKFIHTLFLLCAALVINAQSAHNMQLCSNWDPGYTFNDIWGYANSGKEYAVIGSLSKISVVDVTNPYNVSLVGEVSPGMSSTWRDIKSYGNYIYGVSEANGEGLTVISAAGFNFGFVNITSQSNTEFDRAHNIFVDEPNGRLYVVGGRKGNQSKNIIVYDVAANPANPVHIATSSLTGGYVHDVYVRNNIAYCSHGWFGFGVYDMTNPVSPIELATQTTNGYNHSSWLSTNGDYAFICEEVPESLPILTMDLTDLENNDIQVVASFKEPLLAPTHVDNRPHNPFVVGNLMYVSYYQDGVVVFDVSNPTSPFRVAFYDTSNNSNYFGYEDVWGVYPFLPSGKIIASDQYTGLYVLELEFDAPLSVEFSNFEARIEKDEVVITWSTYNALNDATYEVERSTDGINFQSLEVIVAQGLEDATSNYAKRDKNPMPGTNYYRLKIVDKAGQITYTDHKVINLENNQISIYPTIINGENRLYIDVFTEKRQKFMIEMLNVSGEVVYSTSQEMESDRFVLDTNDFANGLYFLKIDSLNGDKFLTEKIYINR